MLATKLYIPLDDWPNAGGLSALHIRKACEDSLRRLQTDHIDLYQFHHIDRTTPWEEIWEATERLVRDGKVIYVGRSNFAGWDSPPLRRRRRPATSSAGFGAVDLQPDGTDHRAGGAPAARHYGIGLLPWSPLAGGLLAGAAAKAGRRGDDSAMLGHSARKQRIADNLTLRALGVEVYPYRGDAGTYDGVEGFWQFVADLGRPVAAAALNVGVGLGGRFVDNDLADDLKVIAVNITGTVHMAKRVVQHMAANQAGRILIVSSVSATTPTPYETVYGPSKAFGFAFAESLREELKDRGVSVTALLPGATDSDFHANAGLGQTVIGRAAKNDKTLVARQGYDGLIRGTTTSSAVTKPPGRSPSTTARSPKPSRPPGWPRSSGRTEQRPKRMDRRGVLRRVLGR